MTASTIHHFEFDSQLYVELQRQQRRLLLIKTRSELMDTLLIFQKGKMKFGIRRLLFILKSYQYDYCIRNNEDFELVQMANDLLSNEVFYDDIDANEKVNQLIEKVVLSVDEILGNMDPYMGFTVSSN